MTSHPSRWATALLASVLYAAPSAHAGVTTLIPTGTHADFAFDVARQTLYISGTDSLLRYDVSTKSFLDPIYLGGRTAGMDISADGRRLAVANFARGASQNFVDIVDLSTTASTRVAFNLGSGEGGTYTTAFDARNGLLVSSTFEGSGWVPLRRYDLGTKQTSVLGSVRQDSMLAASADRSVVAIAESNISSGPWGLYHAGDSRYASNQSLQWFLYEIGVSREGLQVAIPTYGGTFIDDPRSVIPSIGSYASGQPIGVAYSPLADLVYFPWAESSMVYAYDTTNGRRLEGFDFEESFEFTGNGAFGNGRAKVASDGSYLFVSTDSGVRYMLLSAVPEPHSWLLMGVGLMAVVWHRRSVVRRPREV